MNCMRNAPADATARSSEACDQRFGYFPWP
jgi:hypothetical protein